MLVVRPKPCWAGVEPRLSLNGLKATVPTLGLIVLIIRAERSWRDWCGLRSLCVSGELAASGACGQSSFLSALRAVQVYSVSADSWPRARRSLGVLRRRRQVR